MPSLREDYMALFVFRNLHICIKDDFTVVSSKTLKTVPTLDRHRFDADPDPTFYFDSALDCTYAGKFNFFTFFHSSGSLHCFVFFVSVIGVIIFSTHFG